MDKRSEIVDRIVDLLWSTTLKNNDAVLSAGVLRIVCIQSTQGRSNARFLPIPVGRSLWSSASAAALPLFSPSHPRGASVLGSQHRQIVGRHASNHHTSLSHDVRAQHQRSGRWVTAVATLMGGVFSLGSVAWSEGSEHPPPPHHDAKGWYMMSLNQRRRSFFSYEKRIREFSPPEKVFEYFASQGSIRSGYQMTAGDMMRSVVPVYPPERSDIIRAGSLPGEPSPRLPHEDSSIFNNFDLDNSGGITFDEWLLFQALLSIPAEDVAVAFALMDGDDNGSIDAEEFSVVLASIQSKASRAKASLRRSVSDLSSGRSGMIVSFFGKDGRKELTLAELTKFIDALREDLLRLEFDFYDYENKGAITGKDFAHSVVGWARLKHVDRYLDKVNDMPNHLSNADISFDDFRAFRRALRQSRRLGVALDFWKASGGDVHRQDFEKVTTKVLGSKLPDSILDIIFHIFSNENGELNTAYFIALMERHHENSRKQPWTLEAASKEGAHSNDPPSFLKCLSKCARK